MKQFFILIFFAQQLHAQSLNVSGKIKNYDIHDSVELNIPSLDGVYYRENSSFCKPDPKDKFVFKLPANRPKFAFFKYGNIDQLLLLSPGRTLNIRVCDSNNHQTIIFSGKGKTENALLQALKPDDSPFFIKQINDSIVYAKWPVDSVVKILFPELKKQLEINTQRLKKADLSAEIIKMIASELKYYYATQCLSLGEKLFQYEGKTNREKYYGVFTDSLLSRFDLPTIEDLALSPSANIFLNDYTRYKVRKIMYHFSQDPDKARAQRYIAGILDGTSWEEIQHLAEEYGEGLAFVTLFDNHILPEYAWERLMSDYLIYYCSIKDIGAAERLLDRLETNFPNGPYLNFCKKRIESIRNLKQQNNGNSGIVFRKEDLTTISFKKLMEPYKGKVIYLDIWGTWCGPCLNEMQYAGLLQSHFKNRSIVFLYIDVDDDQFEERWRDFIVTNDLKGEHLRLPRNKMDLFWSELGIPESEQRYPYYLIVNKDGKIVVKDTKRPSDRNELYDQLSMILNK